MAEERSGVGLQVWKATEARKSAASAVSCCVPLRPTGWACFETCRCQEQNASPLRNPLLKVTVCSKPAVTGGPCTSQVLKQLLKPFWIPRPMRGWSHDLHREPRDADGRSTGELRSWCLSGDHSLFAGKHCVAFSPWQGGMHSGADFASETILETQRLSPWTPLALRPVTSPRG